jgi:hypothetical protein
MSSIDSLSFVRYILSTYVLPICSVFGIIGCLLNITIFLKKSLRSNACSVYMLAISIVNLIEIPYTIGRSTNIPYLPSDSRQVSSVFCKVTSYVLHYLLNVVRTYTVLACIDRFALCSSSVHTRSFSSLKVARRLVILMTIVWLFIPIHVIFFYGNVTPQRCGAIGTYGIFFSIYSATITGTHLILMIIFSLLAARSLRQTQSRIQPMIVHGNNRSLIKKRDVHFMKMLFGEVVIYVLTSMMFPIYIIYSVVTANTTKTPSRLAVEGFLAYLVPDFLVEINPCTTFYIYFCASQAFRNSCKQLFTCKWWKNNTLQDIQMVDRPGNIGHNHQNAATNENNNGDQIF